MPTRPRPGVCPRCADQRAPPVAFVLHDVLRALGGDGLPVTFTSQRHSTRREGRHREAGVLSRRLVVQVGDARRRLDFASLVCTRSRVSSPGLHLLPVRMEQILTSVRMLLAACKGAALCLARVLCMRCARAALESQCIQPDSVHLIAKWLVCADVCRTNLER